MIKNRLEAFSDGMFAILLTILVLELHVPNLADSSFTVFANAMLGLAPKFLSFLFSFFIIAIFWVNHHHMVHLGSDYLFPTCKGTFRVVVAANSIRP